MANCNDCKIPDSATTLTTMPEGTALFCPFCLSRHKIAVGMMDDGAKPIAVLHWLYPGLTFIDMSEKPLSWISDIVKFRPRIE